jgi:2-polyprenyl-3-methyl-5-hydroxy-6-metoxy-1,4-benzoquinol methylase
MKRIPDALLARMAQRLSDEDRDEMAIPSYLHPNPLMRWMAWRRVEVVAKRLEALCASRRGQATIVDFGCGTGVLFDQALRCGRRVVGIDVVLDSARLLAAEWKLDVELKTPAQAREEIEPGTVDVIVAAEVLEHVDPLGESLALFQTWLKSDGILLVSLPTENRLYRLGRRLAGFQGHYHHDNARSIDGAIREIGFQGQSRSYIPLPGPLAIYWVAEYVQPR